MLNENDVVMERFYYLNRISSPDGGHEIHTYGCENNPEPLFQISLGFYKNYHAALEEAKTYFNNVRPCQHCCHTPFFKARTSQKKKLVNL